MRPRKSRLRYVQYLSGFRYSRRVASAGGLSGRVVPRIRTASRARPIGFRAL